MELPESLRPLFWDCDFSAIDESRDREFVVGRILVSGTWDMIQWARRVYGDPVIRDWIMRRQGRPLSSPQLRLWETLLDLPTTDVTDWLASPERQAWEGAGAA